MRFGLLPMEGGYTPPGTHDFEWYSLWPGVLPDWFNKPLAQAIIAALLVIILWALVSRNLKVQPGKGQFVAEYIYEFVRNGIARDTLHADYRRWLPWLLALFSFILVNNLFGQFFFFMYPTFGNVGYAYGIAIVAWFIYVIAGFSKFGVGFLRRALIPEGVPWYLYPLIIPLELLATFITRPITLALRLFTNMFAGHLVAVVFVVGGAFLLTYENNILFNISGAISFAFSIVFMALKLFLGALQAYIFTVLTAQYVSTSISEAH